MFTIVNFLAVTLLICCLAYNPVSALNISCPVYDIYGQCGVGANPPRGFCNSTGGICECYEQYAGLNCNYTRKSRLVAFLLSIFVGTYGADRFYLGLIGTAVGKLIITLAFLIACCCGGIVKGVMASEDGNAGTIAAVVVCVIGCILFLAEFIWWLVDVIRIGEGDLHDSKGYATNPNL